jgi:hypothetical protein
MGKIAEKSYKTGENAGKIRNFAECKGKTPVSAAARRVSGGAVQAPGQRLSIRPPAAVDNVPNRAATPPFRASFFDRHFLS